MLSIEKINELKYSTTMANCKGCTNSCRLTINKFSGGRQYISGNRCERGIGKEKKQRSYSEPVRIQIQTDLRLPAACRRMKRSAERSAFRECSICLRIIRSGTRFFTQLKYRVVLSPTSSRKIYELGIESIPSESECYPAKLAHGHVTWLLTPRCEVHLLPVYPVRAHRVPGSHQPLQLPDRYLVCGKYQKQRGRAAGPIPLRSAIRSLRLRAEKVLADGLVKEFSGLPEDEVRAAVHAGWEELGAARQRYAEKRRGNASVYERNRPQRHRACRPSVPHRSGNPSRYPGY